ncbi:MAG: lipoyl synthase [Sedimentibacter sp.]|uniref:lipoyl synthase n=1 Tax=Sedimentibacter sp. TaxID=1960295 RepID=UPI003158452A
MERKYPDWLKIKVKSSQDINYVNDLLKTLNLNTVCEHANCPNLMECYNRKTATFMILGSMCTRNCTFCNVTKGKTENVDPHEPEHVAQAVRKLGLKHVVVTSVTRDDLEDGGAGHFADVIKRIKELNSSVTVEVLIPDFAGNEAALKKVVVAKPEIINHNIETVQRLYAEVRPKADYRRSLELLENIKNMDGTILSKSGIMVGLGEKESEVIEVFKDLRSVGCDILTVGQYLAPSPQHHPVVEYIHPDIFSMYKERAEEMGFKYVASAPLVRSSYHADKALEA